MLSCESIFLVVDPKVSLENFEKKIFHNLFRIILELLNNIKKHAEATEITVLLRCPKTQAESKQSLIVFITDDGKGLTKDELLQMNSRKIRTTKNMHFGIRNIKLRLREIGGTIKYMSDEGEGTTVELDL